MKQILLLALALCFAVAPSEALTPLRKRNKQLKDSIESVNRQLLIQKIRTDSLSRDNAELNEKNDAITYGQEALARENETLAQFNKDLLSINDSLDYTIARYELQEECLNSRIDSLRAVIEQDRTTFRSEISRLLRSERKWGRQNFVNFGYAFQQMSVGEGSRVSSRLAPSVTFGRTYYLHRRALGGMVKFGLDWSFFDVSVAAYEAVPELTSTIDPANDIYKFEAGMQFGPSITVNPTDFLKVSVYFRYAPTLSMLLDEAQAFHASYGSFCNTGVSVSYKVISIGGEYRWGSSEFGDPKTEYNIRSPRLYISFRY